MFLLEPVGFRLTIGSVRDGDHVVIIPHVSRETWPGDDMMVSPCAGAIAMPLVNQPTSLPTNKLMVATLIGPAATEVWGQVMTDLYPTLAGPAMSMLAGGVAAMLVGYFVKDRANV